MTTEVSTGRLFVRTIVMPAAAAVEGTVMRGGCHAVAPVCTEPFMALQVIPPAPTEVDGVAETALPHVQPHMATTLPSDRDVVCRLALRFTVT
jgi:hypothetical protein